MPAFNLFIAGMKDFNPCLLLATAGTLDLVDDDQVSRRFIDKDGKRVEKVFKHADVFDKYYKSRHAVDDSNNARQGLWKLLRSTVISHVFPCRLQID